MSGPGTEHHARLAEEEQRNVTLTRTEEECRSIFENLEVKLEQHGSLTGGKLEEHCPTFVWGGSSVVQSQFMQWLRAWVATQILWKLKVFIIVLIPMLADEFPAFNPNGFIPNFVLALCSLYPLLFFHCFHPQMDLSENRIPQNPMII